MTKPAAVPTAAGLFFASVTAQMRTAGRDHNPVPATCQFSTTPTPRHYQLSFRNRRNGKESTMPTDIHDGREPSTRQEFVTVAEVARLLRCDPRTVLNRIHAGELEGVRDQRRWLVPVADYYRYKSKLQGGRP